VSQDASTLTPRQQAIYQFICETIRKRGYGPTVREVGKRFNIRSPNGVVCHLRALEQKGFIERRAHAARAIWPRGHSMLLRPVTLYGRVAAGAPIVAQEVPGELDLGDLFSDPKVIALEVQGSSMIEDHIQDGDYILVRRQPDAQNGQRVVAVVDGEVTLKRFYRERNRIRLEPANEAMQPIYVTPDRNIEIVGVLVGVIRRC